MKTHPGTPSPARRLIFCTAFLTLCESPALALCNDDWLQVSEVHNGDALELHATNKQDFPITFGLMVEGTPSPVSDTLTAHESHKILEFEGDHPPRLSCNWTIGSRHAAHDDDHLYLLPYAGGSRFRVLQGFDSQWSHRGEEQFAVDFRMPVGTPVHAARDGVVARVEESWNVGCWAEGCSRYANFVVVLHDDGTTGEYYHLQQGGAMVAVGDRVRAGQRIGLSGNTGRTAEPHLHFAVYRATKGGVSQSIPVSFISSGGIVYKPRNGHYYHAISMLSAGD